MNDNTDEFHSKDLNFCVALILSGNPISKTYRIGKETFFVFLNKIQCENILDDYLHNKVKVDAFKYSQLFKKIRNFVKDGFDEIKDIKGG